MLFIYEEHPEQTLFYYFTPEKVAEIKREHGESFFEEIQGAYVNGGFGGKEDKLCRFLFDREGVNQLSNYGTSLKTQELLHLGEKGMDLKSVVICGYLL